MILILALIMHVLADFYFQTDSMAHEKREKVNVFVRHLIIYSVCMFIVVIPFIFSVPVSSLVVVWLLLAGSHALIDLVKWRIQKTAKAKTVNPSKEAWLFLVDQVLHVICISLILLVIPFDASHFGQNAVAQNLGRMALNDIAAVILVILFLCKPAAIIVRIVLKCVQRDKDAENQGIERAGTAIGILERMIIAVFALCGQPAAIAFVIAAKSLARFKQLENQDFAERYLVGTLLSTLLALVVSLAAQLFLMG